MAIRAIRGLCGIGVLHGLTSNYYIDSCIRKFCTFNMLNEIHLFYFLHDNCVSLTDLMPLKSVLKSIYVIVIQNFIHLSIRLVKERDIKETR